MQEYPELPTEIPEKATKKGTAHSAQNVIAPCRAAL